MSEEARPTIRSRVVAGIHVETASPAAGAPSRPAPILYIHGGGQGSWAFHRFLPFFAARGWEGHALNWYGHNGSQVPAGVDLMDRGIADLTQEVAAVAADLGRPAVLLGHSMGGLAVLKHAEANPAAAVVMVASVVPAEVGSPVTEFAFEPGVPYPPPPFAIAHAAFFDGSSEEARGYYARLHDISPRQLRDGSRHTVGVARDAVSVPVLAVGGELDPLCPAVEMGRMAEMYGFDFHCQPGRGHNLPLERNWRETATLIAEWLERVVR